MTRSLLLLPALLLLAGLLDLDMSLSRAKFQDLTADLLARTRKPFEQAISDAGLTKGQIDHVVLVGGSTRMPAVAELVLEMTGSEPNKSVNPDEVVAQGAAIQAGSLSGALYRGGAFLLPLSDGKHTHGPATTLDARVEQICENAAQAAERQLDHALAELFRKPTARPLDPAHGNRQIANPNDPSAPIDAEYRVLTATTEPPARES